VERVGAEYPSCVTFSIQSAFKFDHPADRVRAACEYLKSREIGPATPMDVEHALAVTERYSDAYRRRVVELAPHINRMAKYVPPRRARKLHIGLFGYARELGDVTLPRAISFTCALYSMGLPPELIGFDALTESDLVYLDDAHPSFGAKIAEALRYTDFEGPLMTTSLREALERTGFGFETDTEHLEVVRKMRAALDTEETSQLTELVTRAALSRRFLG
jgi:phosphoenolpyruvate carboxylase